MNLINSNGYAVGVPLINAAGKRNAIDVEPGSTAVSDEWNVLGQTPAGITVEGQVEFAKPEPAPKPEPEPEPVEEVAVEEATPAETPEKEEETVQNSGIKNASDTTLATASVEVGVEDNHENSGGRNNRGNRSGGNRRNKS